MPGNSISVISSVIPSVYRVCTYRLMYI